MFDEGVIMEGYEKHSFRIKKILDIKCVLKTNWMIILSGCCKP